MESTRFLRKYIDLLSYDTPQNSLPIIIFTVINIFVEINMFMAVLVDLQNEEKTLLILVVILINTIFFCNIIRRNLNNQEATKLMDLIEDDFSSISHNELTDRNELWLKIHEYNKKKRINMRALSRNVAVIMFVCGLLIANKNVLDYFFGLTTSHSENESINWPTPYVTYCPPELKSNIFFIYTYFLHSLLFAVYCTEQFLIIVLVSLSTERVLADFDILIFLLDDLTHVFPDPDTCAGYNNMSQAIRQQKNNDSFCITQTENLRRDMALIVHHHQALNRNFKISADGSGCMISIVNLVIMVYCCTMAYLTLTTNDSKKRVNFTVSFILVSLSVFYAYHNGQRIFNQNDILRRSLAEVPWTDKPRWFKQTLHIMMTRANVDTEMRPYGIYTLNYMSFKDLMKTAYSIGNILYTKKMRSQLQQ